MNLHQLKETLGVTTFPLQKCVSKKNEVIHIGWTETTYGRTQIICGDDVLKQLGTSANLKLSEPKTLADEKGVPYIRITICIDEREESEKKKNNMRKCKDKKKNLNMK